MSLGKILIGLAAAFLAGIIVSTVYFYFDLYHGLSQERQQIKEELKARRASESQMKKDMSRLETALEETTAELARKARLVEDLQVKMEKFTALTPHIKPKKETVAAEANKPRDASQKAQSATQTLTETVRHPYRQEMAPGAASERARARAKRPVIRRSAIALQVKDREPVEVSESVSVPDQRVYCWMHVINGEGEKITVRWISKGQRIGEAHLPVGSNSWRTWSYITLRPSMIGPARAEILDENGNLLKTLSFEITQPAASANTG